LVVVPTLLPAAPLAVRRTYLIVVLGGADACFSQQTHVLAAVAPPTPAEQSVSGVDAMLTACANILDCGAQAGAQITACGNRRRTLGR
jgi:hypothetical protein